MTVSPSDLEGGYAMGAVDVALRAIEVALTYHIKCPFVLGDKRYIMVGQVQDLANAYVCIWVDDETITRSLVLVTFYPEEDRADIRYIEQNDSLSVGDRQWLECEFLSALTAWTLLRTAEELPTAEERMLAAVTFAEITMRLAMAAGIFNNRDAYDNLMAYGQNARPRGKARKSPQLRHLERLRRDCRFGDAASIVEYGKLLVGSRAIEIVYLGADEPELG